MALVIFQSKVWALFVISNYIKIITSYGIQVKIHQKQSLLCSVCNGSKKTKILHNYRCGKIKVLHLYNGNLSGIRLENTSDIIFVGNMNITFYKYNIVKIHINNILS